jgi:hypothetical protein
MNWRGAISSYALMVPYRTLRPPHVLSGPLQIFLKTEAGQDFRSLTGRFPSAWKFFVMGGFLREMLLANPPNDRGKPHDVDLVIAGANSIDEIRRVLGDAHQSTNSFGGAKCRLRPDGLVFDLWRIEDHTNMAAAPKPHTIEQLLRHNLLDVDAILWEPASDCLHDCGCLDAITAGCIGLMGPEGVSEKFIAAQLVHILIVAYKTNFTLSEEIRDFVAVSSQRCAPGEIERMLERKIPHAAVQIETFWKDILSGGVQACPAPTRTPAPQKHLKQSSSALNTRP